MGGSAPVKVRVRWPVWSRWWSAAAVVASVVAIVTGNVALSVVLGWLLGAWLVRGVRVELHGGGFRPLRTIDLLELNAADQLDNYDREQAIAAARNG